jgi:hypothetical protein
VAELKIVPVRTVVSPEERKRRLSRVYTILLDLAAQQEAAERLNAAKECSPAMDGAQAAQE